MKQILLSTLLFLSINAALCATPYNIAPQAKVTATSEYNDTYRAALACDGIIGISDRGEWASKSSVSHWGGITFPRIKLEWENERNIDRI
ncbi:MAG: hypothetical protein LBU65_07670, partial [Planctomycetaceae bacterium]|nr:hypothetical protein [Planctomycetaceae bacterium]